MTRTNNNDLQIALSHATSALELIASPIRPDGTYNRCRAACEKIAVDALVQVRLALIPEAEAQDMPVTDDASSIPVRHFERLTIYTDGSRRVGCKGNSGPAGWGVVVVGEDGTVLRETYGFIVDATSQAAKLEAAIAGLSQACEGSVIEIVSDSQYFIKGLSKWRAKWECRGFVNSAGDTVENKEQWKRLYAIADQRKVSVRWFRDQSGDQHNARCKVLASIAIGILNNS